EVLTTSGLEECEFSFTAQLLPIHRGILETIYFKGVAGIKTAQDLIEIYQAAYENEPFVRVYPAGPIAELRRAADTDDCGISLYYDRVHRRAVVISSIDNLVKGAAGQAMQNLNLALGWPETAGLL